MGRLSGFKMRDVTKRLSTLGFAFRREGSGSHELWQHPDGREVSLVRHTGDYPEGLLRATLRRGGVTPEQFLAAK